MENFPRFSFSGKLDNPTLKFKILKNTNFHYCIKFGFETLIRFYAFQSSRKVNNVYGMQKIARLRPPHRKGTARYSLGQQIVRHFL